MITLLENDPANGQWLNLYATAVFITKSLPKENGMHYAMQHLIDEVRDIHNDDIVFQIREIRPYFAAIVVKAMQETREESLYFQGVYYGYFLLHLGLRYHQQDSLQGVLRLVTQAHNYSQYRSAMIYRDVLGYIKKDIQGQRHASLDALRNDTLHYFDKIRRSSLRAKEKQQTLLACCHVLHCFH